MMLRSLLAWVAAALILFSDCSLASDKLPADDFAREWNFRVLLNDKEVGFHQFRLASVDGQMTLASRARFDVRFLFVNAYRYRHTNYEIWEDSCLVAMETETSVNGDDTSVVGQRRGGGLLVATGGEDKTLEGCVMSFAYWDPSILDRRQLLNAQTGEYLDVDIASPASGTVTVRGLKTAADRYRITAKDMQIDVWYSAEMEWLGLESLTSSGRVIRYELT